MQFEEHVIGVRREDLEFIRRQELERGYSSPNILYSKVSTLLEGDRPLITIGKIESVKDAFHKLVQHKILSVPVYNNQLGKYTAFIDIIDIACYTFDALSRDILSSYDTFSSHPDFNVPSAHLAEKGQRNIFVSIEEECTIKSAIETFHKRGVYRLAVVNAAGELTNILTQSALIHWLSEKSKFLPFATKKLAEISFISRENRLEKTGGVISVNIYESAAFAFKTILEHNISGVAIVDDENHLISNLSLSDLKTLGFDNYMLCNLYLPLASYLKLGKTEIRKAITISKEITFAELLETLTTNKIHRVYIVDEEGVPVDVITLSDVIDFLANTEITYDDFLGE